MNQIKIFVRELFQNERTFLIDSRYSMGDFLQDIATDNHHHYQRSFFSLENNCFVDLSKSFQENQIVSFDHLLLV